MRNLLNANFLRLKKNRLFYGTLAAGVFLAFFRTHTLWRDHVEVGVVSTLDETLFTYAQLIGLTAAVFISLFLGTEYSDGAIRNKVTSGCSRVAIYLSALLTTLIASVLSLIAYWVVALVMGIPLLEPSAVSVGGILFTVLGVLLMTAVFCAIFTFVTMNCSSKAASAVACILLFFILLIASTYVYARLTPPNSSPTIASLMVGSQPRSRCPTPDTSSRGRGRSLNSSGTSCPPDKASSTASRLSPIRLACSCALSASPPRSLRADAPCSAKKIYADFPA